MSVAEWIGEVWTLEGQRRLFRRTVRMEERTTREKADRLGYGGLEETAEWRVRQSMCGKNLPEGEER